MTKTYEGNGEHTVHFDSGKTIILHDDEITEISESHVSIEVYKEQTNAIKDAKSILDDLHGAVKELSPGGVASAIKSLIFEMDEVLTIAKRQTLDF